MGQSFSTTVPKETAGILITKLHPSEHAMVTRGVYYGERYQNSQAAKPVATDINAEYNTGKKKNCCKAGLTPGRSKAKKSVAVFPN